MTKLFTEVSAIWILRKIKGALFGSLLKKTPSAFCTTFVSFFYDSAVILCLVTAKGLSRNRVWVQVHAKNMSDRSLGTFPKRPQPTAFRLPILHPSPPPMCAVVSLLSTRTHAKRLSVRPEELLNWEWLPLIFQHSMKFSRTFEQLYHPNAKPLKKQPCD